MLHSVIGFFFFLTGLLGDRFRCLYWICKDVSISSDKIDFGVHITGFEYLSDLFVLLRTNNTAHRTAYFVQVSPSAYHQSTIPDISDPGIRSKVRKSWQCFQSNIRLVKTLRPWWGDPAPNLNGDKTAVGLN